MKKMKTKTKIVVLAEIAVVLCAVFLVAIPAIAAEQNQAMQANTSTIATASEDDYVLGIYGNANEDDTIDMGDVVYTKLAIFGKKPKTELCDAKYDGRINVLDVIQTKLIILGREKEITVKDYDGETVTVHKPVKKIVALMPDSIESLRAINAEDKIVGISSSINTDEVFFPEISKLPSVGSFRNIDYEVILSLNPDVLMPLGTMKKEQKEKLPGITIVYLGLRFVKDFSENVRKLGYIFDKEEEADEFANWYESWINKIKSRTEGLSDDEKPRVFLWVRYKPGGDYLTEAKGYRVDQICKIAGGKNIAEDLPSTGRCPKVEAEWVIEQNPDVIVALAQRPSLYGYNVDDPSEMKAMWEEIMNRPELANVNAVKNGNVYILCLRLWLKPSGGGCLVGIPYMAKWFHPELFEDWDSWAIHQEYITRFQHLDFDVYEHGVFVYHPEKHPDGR